MQEQKAASRLKTYIPILGWLPLYQTAWLADLEEEGRRFPTVDAAVRSLES
jgi:hypothetical protein